MSQTTVRSARESISDAVPEPSLQDPNKSTEHKTEDASQDVSEPSDMSKPTSAHLSHAQIFTIMACLCACVFVAAMDITIVTTALPAIGGHFASSSGYTWIGTAFVLAHTASTPSWGKLSDIWGRRPMLLAANAIFLAGSLMCALVGDLGAFIAARALQGVGAGGLQTMVNICISDMFSQRERGMWYGLTSVVWAVASGIGPVLGGVFTSKLSWKWCFWINIPITGAVFLLLLFTLKLPSPNTPLRAGFMAIDWTGSLLIIGGTLMLLLGLYLGGVYSPWHSAKVVCLLVFGVLTGGLFVLNEWKLAAYPLMPVQLFRTRASAGAYAVCFFHAFVFMGVAYYLPLYFQAVLLASPLMSGVYLLWFILSSSITAALTGLFIQRTGQYAPAVWVGLPVMTLGIGMLVDMGLEHNWAKLVLFQIVGGCGVGMNFEGPLLAVQAEVATRDVAAATTTMGFVRTISTAISVVIGGVVFQNEMAQRNQVLREAAGEQVASLFNGTSASANVELVRKLPEAAQLVVRRAFCDSMRTMWIVYVSISAFGIFLGFLIRAHHLSEEHEAAHLGLDSPKKDRAAQCSGVLVGSDAAAGGERCCCR